jgi:hypothetical protein
VSYNSLCKGAAVELKNFKGSTSPAAVYTTHSSFIYRHLNSILEKIIPAGIPHYLYDYYSLMLFKKFQPFVDKSPRILTVNDLSFGFVLWLCACSVSTAAFLMETVSFKIRKLVHELFGLCGLLRTLLSFQYV